MNMIIDKSNSYEFAHILLDMGEAMLCSGAEINRVEETFLKIGASYKVKEINVFVIPALITLTIRTNEGFELTQSRRILSKKITTNLYRLEKFNNITHNCRTNTFSLNELKKMISDSNKPVSIYPFLFGSALAATSFSVFFGGSICDGLIAGLLAFVICFFQIISEEELETDYILPKAFDTRVGAAVASAVAKAAKDTGVAKT